ncbi:lysophosphatidic acid receptor 6-like [Scleropages formosus]|uniref:G protein-coupled receptor 55a n=1 Tax=Scleropages formosus TaxID=113540 RepID=A0A0P7WMX3_SCLFO|nr:G-protein coupled receptor 55-like isoform X1 [Scleropages formosus]XP_018604085.1 G-protein coupled receptor 55-like isoform X1 [Scleropages formosus]KPP62413.1 lysophosphatidic acid receptor 6-like [Scleropages formosus]
MADAVRWVQYATYLPTIIVSLPLNLAALWMLFFKIRRFTESTVYLTNLVINDCLLLFSLPFKIYAYDTEWNLSSTFCSFLESLVYVNIYGSIGLIVCISMDRYVALKYPFQMTRLRSPRKAAVICLFIWITIFGASIPVYSLHDAKAFCFQNFSNSTWDRVGIVVAMETTFCISAVVMIFCSIQVVLILQKMRRRNPLDKKLRNNKSVKIVLSNLITFLVCFIPYHVAALLYFLAKKQVITGFNGRLRDFVHISSCLSSVNCLFDGVCYYFILKENEQSVKQERWHLFSVTQRSILRNEGPKTQESAENLSTGVSKTQNTACP